MAVCSASAASFLGFSRKPALSSLPELSASRSRWCCPPIARRAAGLRSLSTLPRRQILPRIEAKKLTFSSFDDLLEKSDKPVLVDFYATWCGPCQFMVPVLEEVSEKMNDKIQVVKIDTEKYPSIADRYQIQALPTLIIFKDGKPCDRFEGALTADQLIQRVESIVSVTQ